MVGWIPSLEPPKFPQDDKNVYPRKTPKSVNTRPCWHCGSGKHWDYECKHSRKGERQARTHFITLSNPEIEALNAYDNLYYDLESEDESTEDQQDFCEPLPGSDQNLWVKLEDKSNLEGPQDQIAMPATDISESFFTTARNPNLQLGPDFTNTMKFPLNWVTQRNLEKNILRVYHTISNPTDLKEPMVKLHKYMAQPLGCSFLGATAAHVPVMVNSPMENPILVMCWDHYHSSVTHLPSVPPPSIK